MASSTAAAAPRSTLDPSEQGPAWNLGDLYTSRNDPRLEADLAGAASTAEALEAEFKGRLPELDGDGLAGMLERYEALDEDIGRRYSYAQLLFAASRDDAEVGRFFQTVQERVNGSRPSSSSSRWS
jgi:oligoendopeptidase F